MPTLLLRLAAPLCAAAALSTGATAQGLALDAPRLVIATSGNAPVTLRAVKLRTEINGRSALTEVMLTFFNPNPRTLEGELQFPLAEGQAVVGMAMEVGGRLREAVSVDKARGEAVFEDVTRTRIDPALLSRTQGDNHKLRIYPIEAGREKVVVLRYAEWLAPRGAGSVYRLPLAYGDRLAALSVAVRASGVAAAPHAGAGGIALPAFTRDGDGYRMAFERHDVVARGALEVELQTAPGGSVTTQRRDDAGYFLAQLPVAGEVAPRVLPRTVSLVWDSSGSGAQRDHAREFALLDAYFERARNVELLLTRVRDAAEPVQRFRIVGGDWRALRRTLEATVYDGATDLGAFVPDADAGEVLLFSDGLSNFGMQRFPASAVAIYAVSAAARSDPLRLRQLAETSGGRFIDLLQDSAAAARAKLLNASSRVVAITAEGATLLLAVSPYPSDGSLTLAGRLSAPRARLHVTVLHPSGRRQLLHLSIDAERSAGVLAAQGWARLRIAALDAEYELNRAEIRRLGSAFGIVTRETSLIILDRAQDYARHAITPPPELADEVARLREQLRQAEQAGERAQLDRVARLFEARQAWWRREFPQGTPPRAAETNAAAPIAGAVMQGSRRDDRARESLAAPRAIAAAPALRAGPQGTFSADAAAPLMKAGAATPGDATPVATIRLRPAVADAPYAARLRAARTEALYRIYLDERPAYANSSAFLLDVADLLFERGQPALGTRVLSNLAEMDLENRQLLRILGHRLVQAGRADLALPVFRRVALLAPDEPQSGRDLGLALAANHEPQAAIDALYEVVRRPWPRFPEVELIALTELNAIVATSPQPLDTSRIDPRLLKNLPLDLRATLSWDTDNTDIDLWITDPNGEKTFYGNPASYQGGRMSKDIIGGYGPEEFSLHRAKPGRYQVHANFYGHSQQIVSGSTTLQLLLSTGFGTAQQKDQRITLRLKGRDDRVFVGEFDVQPAE